MSARQANSDRRSTEDRQSPKTLIGTGVEACSTLPDPLPRADEEFACAFAFFKSTCI